MADDAKEETLQITRKVLHPERPPEAVHKFLFSRVGGTLVLETAFFEMHAFRQTLEKMRADGATSGNVDVYVSHAFQLSPEAVADLIEVAEQLKTKGDVSK